MKDPLITQIKFILLQELAYEKDYFDTIDSLNLL